MNWNSKSMAAAAGEALVGGDEVSYYTTSPVDLQHLPMIAESSCH